MNSYDKEGQSLMLNLPDSNSVEGETVVFYTHRISGDKNDVIHNATGSALRLGKKDNLGPLVRRIWI
jgi:hypothetical protein